MKDTKLTNEAILSLHKAKNARSQFLALEHCSLTTIKTPGQLQMYHDQLLFTCAYPFDEKVYQLTLEELIRLSSILHDHQSNQRWQDALSGSGLPFTQLYCQYSATIAAWLIRQFSEHIRQLDTDVSVEQFQLFCQAALPGIEFYQATQENHSIVKRLKLLSGQNTDIEAWKWFLELLEQNDWDPLLKEQLYDSLKLFVNWHTSGNCFNRSFLRCPVTQIHYRSSENTRVNILECISKPIKKPLALHKGDRESLITVARTSLALYYRETDPVTYASPSETFLFDMGDGLRIMLTGMMPEKRLALESYIGFMAFKNGIPMAYGGGWILGYRCKIGVNIYPAFRGGASAQLFCQVLRLYYQQFNIKRFVVKPYQFGKDNPDGIKSGAFWFYYKLGFRPVEAKVKALANAEWGKIIKDPAYRTSVEILKKFTVCYVSWEPEKLTLPLIDPDQLSIAVTRYVNDHFFGDEQKAIVVSMLQLKKITGFQKLPVDGRSEQKVWENWSLLYSTLPGLQKWNKVQSKYFLGLIHLKATGKEKDYIKALQRFSVFWNAAKQLPGALTEG